MPGSKYFLLNNHKIPWVAYDSRDFFRTFVPNNEPLKQAGEIILNYECLSLLYHKKNLGLILFVPRQMSYSESKLPKLRHTVNFYEVRTNRRM
ncbi:hypothetical protein CIK88_09675 [Prevotella sp. P5-50]|nr:hypothetical protein CIK88_09675 [Prevotella sp. P5-50]